MSALNDSEMDRLSELLAQGNMENADEIATLLKVELGEQARLANSEHLQSFLDLLCHVKNQR